MSADAFIPKHMTAVPSFAHRNAHNVEKEISHRALHTRERTPRLRHTTLSTPPDARRERKSTQTPEARRTGDFGGRFGGSTTPNRAASSEIHSATAMLTFWHPGSVVIECHMFSPCNDSNAVIA